MTEETKAEPKKVCPFWGGHDCVKERCVLWSWRHDSAGGAFECAFTVIAESLSKIEQGGIDIQNHY